MKRILNITLWVVLLVGLITLVAFVRTDYNKTPCAGLEININYQDGNVFVQAEDIRHSLLSLEDSIKGKLIREIDIPALEAEINKNPYVSVSNVYTNVQGMLNVELKQCKPIARMIDSQNKSYYLNDDKSLMPLHWDKAARVRIVSGNIDFNDSIQIEHIFTISNHIYQDEFLDAQIEQIILTKNNEIVLIPKVGNHKVELGGIFNYEEKINNLKSFYINGLADGNWSKYKSVNLKYKNQVVCTKY